VFQVVQKFLEVEAYLLQYLEAVMDLNIKRYLIKDTRTTSTYSLLLLDLYLKSD